MLDDERLPAAPRTVASPAAAAPWPRARPPLAAVIQRVRANPRSLTRADLAQLHGALGNAAVGRLLTGAAANRMGLPSGLKADVEARSGLSMDDVRVHRDSPEPAAVQAHAYARGSEIHLAPGQERHLPHEAWHVVQQKQGRVSPTVRVGQVSVNDEAALEDEADRFASDPSFRLRFHPGRPAVGPEGRSAPLTRDRSGPRGSSQPVTQRCLIGGIEITAKTAISEVEKALDWSRMGGVRVRLSPEQIRELIAELGTNDGFQDIVDSLRDRLEMLDESSDESDETPLGGQNDADQEASLTQDEKLERRRVAAEGFGWDGFPDKHRRFAKIGVHETDVGRLRTLMSAGPSADMLGKGNGLGKGRGFYVTHVGAKTLYNATKAMFYGDAYVAVYVPVDLAVIRSSEEETDRVDILDSLHDDPVCFYVMSGGGEIVIPERCFGMVRFAATRGDLDGF